MGLGKKKKKGAEMPPPPGMPLPPMPPPPGMPLPPAPGVQPATQQTPPPQAAAPIPPPSNPLPAMPVPEMPLPTPQPVAESPQPEASEPDSGYSGLYAKKSGKPLKQVYGHIDRISQGEIGSLLDRYSDRFGHELDRDIIVMRKEEREDKMSEVRDSPTVQLLNQEEAIDSPHDGDTLVELNSQLAVIEAELRRLKPDYQAAKSEGDKQVLRELKPILEGLMAERKLLQGVISGDIDISAMTEDSESESEIEDDIFLTFVSIVDNLLGSNLPEDAINEFTQSAGFETYKEVGSNPASANDELRAEFFQVVDSLLGGMPDEAVSDFVASSDFDIYRTVGGMYN